MDRFLNRYTDKFSATADKDKLVARARAKYLRKMTCEDDFAFYEKATEKGE